MCPVVSIILDVADVRFIVERTRQFDFANARLLIKQHRYFAWSLIAHDVIAQYTGSDQSLTLLCFDELLLAELPTLQLIRSSSSGKNNEGRSPPRRNKIPLAIANEVSVAPDTPST